MCVSQALFRGTELKLSVHVGPCCSVSGHTQVCQLPWGHGKLQVREEEERDARRQCLFTALSPLAQYQQQLQICVPAAERLALGFMYCRIVNNLYFLSGLGKDLNPLEYRLISTVIGSLFVKEWAYIWIRKRMSVLILGKYDSQSCK